MLPFADTIPDTKVRSVDLETQLTMSFFLCCRKSSKRLDDCRSGCKSSSHTVLRFTPKSCGVRSAAQRRGFQLISAESGCPSVSMTTSSHQTIFEHWKYT